MERKYPLKMFLLFVIANFLFHFFYLSVPGAVLCIVGIWVKPCLWIGLIILGFDMILSVIDQLNIRKVAMTHSDNPEFNEFMDACSAADGLDAISKTIEEKTQPKSSVEHQEKDD